MDIKCSKVKGNLDVFLFDIQEGCIGTSRNILEYDAEHEPAKEQVEEKQNECTVSTGCLVFSHRTAQNSYNTEPKQASRLIFKGIKPCRCKKGFNIAAPKLLYQ